MRDQMTAYADPHVNFTVECPTDKMNKRYVVIKINQFKEIPVICRKNGSDTRIGAIYYRNQNRRIESAPISNSYDMRDLIQQATIKMMQNIRKVGFGVKADTSIKKKLDDELNGL